MSPVPKRRPRRVPYSQEEVANIIAFKKRKEQMVLQAFKRTKAYKFQNLFNIICFFVYWEILICFFGPASYSEHRSYKVSAEYAREYDATGKAAISSVEFFSYGYEPFKFIINDFISLPETESVFYVGKDFLLQKPLKGSIGYDSTSYRLFSASPILLLIMITLITSGMAYFYNLNQNSYSLMSVTVLNGLTLIGLIIL